jgi:hypothetical protein
LKRNILGRIYSDNTDSQDTVVANYWFDNLFDIVKMNKNLFFSIFLQFPDMDYEKAGKKGEKSNEKINRYNHRA